MQTNTHTASFRCTKLGLMSSIRSHYNYFKLLQGTQVLVGYITSTLTRDEFHPAHKYTITFCYIFLYTCWHVCVCELTNTHTFVYVCRRT